MRIKHNASVLDDSDGTFYSLWYRVLHCLGQMELRLAHGRSLVGHIYQLTKRRVSSIYFPSAFKAHVIFSAKNLLAHNQHSKP